MDKPDQNIKLESIVMRNPGIIHSEMDDEIVMMSVEQGLFFGINSVGADIWKLLEVPLKVEELTNLLMNKYNVSREVCETETLRFLNNLLLKQVILIVKV